ncbi:MAG: peptidylprolyl isomerase [Dehalococcoidia bacterium]
MTKKRRQRPLPIPPRPRRRPWSREFRLQVAVVAAFALLLVIIAGVVGYAFFQDYYEEHVSRPHSKAVQVGETSFNLDYFARRLKLFMTSLGLQDPTYAQIGISSVISTLEREELLRQRAPADLGLSVSPQEVEQAISDRLGLTQSDPQAFATAYEQALKSNDLSDKEYRQMIEAELLSAKVDQVFSLSVPATAEQVRLRQIQVGTEDEARSVLERLNAGENFADLARELSLDTGTKEEGGERGWVARDELDLSYAAKVFALETGALSEPIPGPGGYYIFQVEERQPDREVTEEQRSTISTIYADLWLREQRTIFAVADIQPLLTDADKYQWAIEKAFGL